MVGYTWGVNTVIHKTACPIRCLRDFRFSAPILAVAPRPHGVDRVRDLLDQDETYLAHEPGRLIGTLARTTGGVRERPRLIYLVDATKSTFLVGVVASAFNIPFVLDTGDVVHALSKSLGRSSIRVSATRWAEQWLHRHASLTITRGREHARLLKGASTLFAPDVAPATARPHDRNRAQAELGLEGQFVVGLVGTLEYAAGLDLVYGWDLVEALSYCSDSVTGVIVGEGSGLALLRRRAAELGVENRCLFLGPIPPSEVAPVISAFDFGLSTQTNDVVGMVRTTGKLPLYLACGCPVLASAVGEAPYVLPPDWTVPYRGQVDRGYPQRLAAKITDFSTGSPEEWMARHSVALELSDRHYSRQRVREVVHQAIRELLRPEREQGP